MKHSANRMLFISALVLPLIPLSYLFSVNFEYLDSVQVLVAGLGMVLLSAIGYGVFRLLFRSSLSAFAGCLALWCVFFAYGSLHDELSDLFKGYSKYYVTLAAGAGLSVLLAALARKIKADWLPVLLSTMLGVLLLINAVPVAQAIYSDSSFDKAAVYKTEYTVDAALPSPNVYWIHADGMLGFSAFETYYGDDQQALKDALSARGFVYNEDAYFEAGHQTNVGVAALMCPFFYDTDLGEKLATHERAMYTARNRESYGYIRNEVHTARVYNETRVAFEQKGYTPQTIAGISNYFPPVAGHHYVTTDPEGGYRFDPDDRSLSSFLSASRMGELSTMLLGVDLSPTLIKSESPFVRKYFFSIDRIPLEHTLDAERANEILLNGSYRGSYRNLLDNLYDSLHTQGPTFTIVENLLSHAPYEYDENGERTGLGKKDIHAYPLQHRFAAKVLINTVDLILESDPDAVIVIQADHGLNAQKERHIVEAFGEAAVLPIWNQVMSAVRVPADDQNGEEHFAYENPLNIARYLVNRFVGQNYTYLE